MKEFLRKRIVSLKRSPQIIAMLFIVISCIIYTFSLVTLSQASIGLYSETAVKAAETKDPSFVVPGVFRNPAISVFLTILFSILLPISFLSVYKNNKTNWFMFSIAIIMVVGMLVLDVIFICSLNFYMAEPYGQLDTDGVYAVSIGRTIIHIVFLAITLISILTKPFYGALLNKIDTSVKDSYDELMEKKSAEELLIDVENE